MKKIFLAVTLLIISKANFAQNNVGIGTTNPHPSTVLHLESQAQNQGFLIPTAYVANVVAPTALSLPRIASFS